MPNVSANVGLSALGLFLSVAITASSIFVSNTVRDIKLNTAITVKGYAEREVQSDLVTWSAQVTARGANQTEAFNKLKTDIPKVVEYLKNQGLQASEISTSSISTQSIFQRNAKGYSTNKVEAYELRQTVSVSSSNVYLVNRLARDVTALINDGISISSYNPQYYYSKVNSLKVELLGEATKNAKIRAKQLAESSDSQVGRLLSARQGVFQITPSNSTDVSDYGTYDTSTIHKAVKAVVTVRYAVE